MACFVVVIAGMRSAQTILVPFLLSVFIAVAAAGPLFWLQAQGVPKVLALLVVLLGVVGLGFALVTFVSTAVSQFTAEDTQAAYQARLEAKLEGLGAWAGEREMFKALQKPIDRVRRALRGEDAGEEDEASPVETETAEPEAGEAPLEEGERAPPDIAADGAVADPTASDAGIELSQYFGSAIGFAGNILAALAAMFTRAFLIFFTVAFILVEASSFPVKFRAIMGESRMGMESLDRFVFTVKRYIAIKTAVSLLTGLSIGLWVALVGLDFPLVWGVFAFLLNYIPNIGSILAAVPAVILALIQPDLGFGHALLTLIGYVLVNILFGNVIEPRFMGRGVGMSTLAVFMSLVFWGWVFGPVGMLLAVPLTMTLKIAVDSSEETRWISILLGPESPSESGPAKAKS